jgi:hypothetical protein
MGLYKYDARRHGAFLANHDAYADQRVRLDIPRPVKVSLFDRKSGQWPPLAIKDGTVTFPLSAGGGELLRFE